MFTGRKHLGDSGLVFNERNYMKPQKSHKLWGCFQSLDIDRCQETSLLTKALCVRSAVRSLILTMVEGKILTEKKNPFVDLSSFPEVFVKIISLLNRLYHKSMAQSYKKS